MEVGRPSIGAAQCRHFCNPWPNFMRSIETSNLINGFVFHAAVRDFLHFSAARLAIFAF